jgi:hypothetical protein
MVEHPGPELLDENAAAKYIDMSVDFLQAGRCRGRLGNATPAPPHLKLGRSVRYDRRDLDGWLAERRSRAPGQSVTTRPARATDAFKVTPMQMDQLAEQLVQAIVAELRKQTEGKAANR